MYRAGDLSQREPITRSAFNVGRDPGNHWLVEHADVGEVHAAIEAVSVDGVSLMELGSVRGRG